MNTQTDRISDKYPMTLSKFLSHAGVASRRKCSFIIINGEVRVNGRTEKHPGFRVSKEDSVEYNGKSVQVGKRYYIVLNKPRGYICTSQDPYAKKKAIDLIDLPEARLFSVGRLDKDSEGLIIFTNDGAYAEKLTHPRHSIMKKYRVTTDKRLSKNDMQNFCTGIIDSGEKLRAENVTEEKECVYTFIMSEGKKREIRRLIKSAGKKTVRLQRIAIGGLSLNNLPLGEWRYLKEEEITSTLS